jgi:hypothetical protein
MIGSGVASDLLFRDDIAANFELADVTQTASGIVILSDRLSWFVVFTARCRSMIPTSSST